MSLGKACTILVLFLCIAFGKNALAAEFLPKEIHFVNPASSFEAGSVQDMGMVPSERMGRNNLIFDYGVAREIVQDNITSYEIISSDTATNTNQIRFSVDIPNVIPAYASSTYVAFLKSYAPTRPETQNFFVTEPFAIQTNDSPYMQITHINLLQSDGTRAGLEDGPTIHDPKIAASESMPINTALEMTIESNQDTVLQPLVRFNRLRSTAKLQEYIPENIVILKGKNYVKIPLPIFEYEPGIYAGELYLKNNLLPKKIGFHYIVSGESVSIGLASSDTNGVVTLEIFGTPMDIQNSTSTAEPEIHTLQTSFFYKGKEVYGTTSPEVDFTQGSTSVAIPGNVRDVDAVFVRVFSHTTDKVLFEDTKSITFNREKRPHNWQLYYILLMCILIATAYKKHKVKFIVALLVLCGVIAAQRAYGDMFRPEEYVKTDFAYNNKVSLYLNDDIQKLVQSCGKKLSFLYGVYYTVAASTYNGNMAGFSVLSSKDADSKRMEAVLAAGSEGPRKPHEGWYNIASWFMYTSPTILASDKTLYITVDSNSGTARYTIPITTSPCYACTNATSTSNIPSFQKYGRSYYFSTTTGMLYYKKAGEENTPGACGIDMCSNTEADEADFPADLTWSSLRPVHTSDPNTFSCVPYKVSCACNGRNMMCVNDTTGTSTAIEQDPACKFQAFCSVIENAQNGGMVTFDAYNKLGSVTYANTGNGIPAGSGTSTSNGFSQNGVYISVKIPVGGKTISNTLTDSFDGSVSTVSCRLNGTKPAATSSNYIGGTN